MARKRKRNRPAAVGRSLRWQDLEEGGRIPFVVIGRLRKPHGLRGHMLLEVLTDYPQARFYPGAVIHVGPRRVPLTIREVQPHRDGLLLAFEGYPDRTSVEPLRNQWVTIQTEEVIPAQEEDAYYDFQVLGARVETEEGRLLGQLVEILETAGNDVFVIEPERGPEILLPVTQEVVLQVEPERRRVVVRLLPGLIPEDHPWHTQTQEGSPSP